MHMVGLLLYTNTVRKPVDGDDNMSKKVRVNWLLAGMVGLIALMSGCGHNRQQSDSSAKSLSQRESIVSRREATAASRSRAEKAAKEKQESEEAAKQEASKKSDADHAASQAASESSASVQSSAQAASERENQTKLVPRQAMFGQWYSDDGMMIIMVKSDFTMMVKSDGRVSYRGPFNTRDETDDSITLVSTQMVADGLAFHFVDSNIVSLGGGGGTYILRRSNNWQPTDPLPNS